MSTLPSTLERRVFAWNISWAVLGNISASLLQWLILIIIAKFGDTLSMGQYAVSLAWVAPLTVFSSLQLRSVQATDARNQFSISDFFTLRCLTSAVALTIICGFALIGRHSDTPPALMILIGLSRLIDGMSDVFYGCLQKYASMRIVARSLLIRGVTQCGVVLIALYCFRSMLLAALAMVAVSVCVTFLHDSLSAQRTAAHYGQAFSNSDLISLGRIRPLLSLTFPLGVASGINSFRGNISRYVVAYVLGTKSVGVFSALVYPNFGILTATAAVGQALSPKFGAHAASGMQSDFNRFVMQVVTISAALAFLTSVVCCFWAPQILSVAYNHAMASFPGVFCCLLAALPFACAASFLNDALVARRRMHQQVTLFLSVGLVEGLVALALVWRLGLMGVAIATLIAAGVQTALASYQVFKARPNCQI